MNKVSTSKYLPWLLFALMTTVPIVAWLQTYDWKVTLTISAIFPLLGVLAWSIMWTHYANGWLQVKYPAKINKNELYSRVSTWLVLGLLLLHPGLLSWQQYRLFGTLPPESFYATVARSAEIFVAIAVFALYYFLSMK